MNTQNFRPGSVGALMDEYERATADFRRALAGVSAAQYAHIVQPGADLQSIKDIVEHVVWSAYIFADYLRTIYDMERTTAGFRTIAYGEIDMHLRGVMEYTVRTLEGRWAPTDDELVETSFTTSWGVRYHLEQWLEHAIVHMLRHRRQVEKILAEKQG